MNGSLAQVVALATYGTQWLTDQSGPPPALDHGNSTFAYVGSVRFDAPGGSFPDVTAFLRGCAQRMVVRLRVAGGGGHWALVADRRPGVAGARHEGKSEVWQPDWVAQLDAPAGQRWAVTYTARELPVPVTAPPPDAAATALRAALARAEAYAARIGEAHWAEWFARALASDGTFRFHPDLVPPGFPDDTRRLLAMAEQGWVFGGMGSWNDLGRADAEYPDVSETLYAAVAEAFCSGTSY